jgi:ABC-type antimicrobial peptide transport system permease subunit
MGATPSHVIRLVVASASPGVALGLAAGLVLSVGLQRILAAWAGITGSPVLLITGAALLLLITAVVASLVPARRALSVDPMTVLRSE